MKDYKYKFSVIMPVFNTGRYLEESIDSVLNQTIGFEKNIQIILVNDGSVDNSEQIILKYKDRYPNNIVYLKQDNEGVSSARNKGICYVEGKYVNFLDSDDKWVPDAFLHIYQFFENHYEDIDLVAARMLYFEAWKKYHRLDYKFKMTKVVDIEDEYSFPQMHVTSSFIKSDIVKEHKFDVNLKYGEDAVYTTEVILQKRKYGVVREAVHMYRRRADATSSVQNKMNMVSYYKDTVDAYYKYLFDLSVRKYGKVLWYVQYLVMYDMQWRIRAQIPSLVPKDNKREYIDAIIEVLNQIDDCIICEQRNINAEHTLYTLSLKYGRDVRNELKFDKGRLYFNNLSVHRLKKNSTILKVSILEIEDGILKLDGIVNTPLKREDFEILVEITKSDFRREEDIRTEKFNLLEGKKSIYTERSWSMTDKVRNHYTYHLEMPLSGVSGIRFLFQYKNDGTAVLQPAFNLFGKLSNLKRSYYAAGDFLLLYQVSKNIIHVYKNSRRIRIRRELSFWKTLIEKKHARDIFLRIRYFILKCFKRKEVWLISDREDKADDNGEHFFRFLCSIKKKGEVSAKNIKPVYVLSRECVDYHKLKKIGRVIPANSLRHKLCFLLSSKIVSSQANNYVINVFGKDSACVKDLYNYKFVFLQHGITKDDGSRWMKKFSKNMKMLVAVARPEYDAFVNGDYYYTEKEVKLTGFPRYDALADPNGLSSEKKILINPTWRKSIKGSYNKKSESVYLDTFKDTEYFKFYNNIINDTRVIEALKEKGYKIKFCMHPIHSKQWVDYKGNDYVEINHGFIDYQYEFRTSALMITDYSSVAFDMAYLRKPVIYSQFDADEFFSGGHSYDKGYYDYETDGFGPVCHDYEETVSELVKAVENDCAIEQKYLDRIDSFYAFDDRNNCRRVYEEILRL